MNEQAEVNVAFRLEAAIVGEQLALAEEKRRVAEAEGRPGSDFQTAHALAHLHRYALRALLTVRDGTPAKHPARRSEVAR